MPFLPKEIKLFFKFLIFPKIFVGEGSHLQKNMVEWVNFKLYLVHPKKISRMHVLVT